MPRSPRDLGEQLEARVERCQIEDAHRSLEAQLEMFLQEGPSGLVAFKYCCAVPMARCVNGAVRAGVPRPAVMALYHERLGQLSRLRSFSATRRHLHSFTDEMLALVKPEQRTSIERLVADIRRDLKEHLDHPSTLKEYADAVGVSRPHVSRCFARIAGRPFREELRAARMQAACKLLRETSLKISVVARQVGVRDACQFIADFRRQTGMTPTAYRRSQVHPPREE